jgi:hypothetical protein
MDKEISLTLLNEISFIFTFSYIPMQDVAPSAVRMADATDAMICTTHLIVSFFVIRVSFLLFWHGFHGLTLLYFIQPCLSKRAVLIRA